MEVSIEDSLMADATALTYLQMAALRSADINILLARTQYLEALYSQSEYLCERMFDNAYDWNCDDKFDTGYRAIEGMVLDSQIRLAEIEVEESTAIVLACVLSNELNAQID
jgi:hypothetical protein